MFISDRDYNNEIDLVKVTTYKKDKSTSAKRLLKSEYSNTFIRFNEALSIIEKVKYENKIDKYVSALRPFGFRGYFINDEKFRSSSENLINPIICYGKGKKMGFLEREEIEVRTNWIDKFKVFTPRANNIATELNDDNLNSFIGKPGTICTESYIVIGADLELNEIESHNLSIYLKTKFVRFLHSLAKSSQDATSKTYKFVPVQDFKENSDIDWRKDVSNIDLELYEKYKLSKEEIQFIEESIKPM